MQSNRYQRTLSREVNRSRRVWPNEESKVDEIGKVKNSPLPEEAKSSVSEVPVVDEREKAKIRVNEEGKI
jgi:hypothetical protein